MSSNTSSKLLGPVVFLTLLFAFWGWLLPDFLRAVQIPILVLLLITIGLPHGATDYMLFKRIKKDNITNKQKIKFFVIYVGCVLGFLGMWLSFPLSSFIVFIIISAYHFGQSNWENTLILKKYKVLINLTWGAFAIGGSVLWHWAESKVFIGQVIGFSVDVSNDFMINAQLILLAVNCLIILILKTYQYIDFSQMLEELGKMFVLSLLFYFTPMLVGFSIYFALWHSLSSLKTQVAYYKKLWPRFTLIDYYRQAAPFTLLASAGFVLMIFSHQYILPDVSIISTFIVFIACVTLPHIFLVDESYQV